MSKGSKALDWQWMVEYTPQEVWIEGRGLLLWLAFFFTEIFAGVYFVSLFLNFKAGLLVGWLGALSLGGLFHLLYLGKATRGWRILTKVLSSELSRGLWAIILFGVFGLLQVAPIVISGLPWTWDKPALKILMGIVCILMIIHGFMILSVVKALPMWNSSMLIPLSLASGIWVGTQIVMIMLQAFGSDMALAEVWIRWALFFYVGALLVYLWGGMHASETSKASMQRILAGDCSAYFYIGAVIIGIVIPLVITLMIWGRDISNLSGGFFFLRFVCVLIGDCAMRYCIMKAPYYSPLV